LLAHRSDINAKLTALSARRDELRAILVASGYLDPDDDGG
jgi:hypothetical protein